MNKLLLGTALATLLLGACNKPADTPAPEAPAPSADATTATAPAAATSTADTAVDTAPVAPTASDDSAVDAAIDNILGDHTKYQAVINAYQKAVAASDKEGVAALVDYPLAATIDGKQTSIKDAADFVRNYDKIVTPAIAGVIKAQKYSELMVNGKGVMFGSGETWINGVCKQGSADCSEFEVKVVTIQPGVSG
jgi:hypothetical protein